MKISTATSMLTNMFYYGDANNLDRAFDIAKQAGFDSMDVSLSFYCRGDNVFTTDNHIEWAEKTREYADVHGISINQTHGDALNNLQWDDPDCPDQKDFTLRNLRCIEASKILGAKWMVVHPMNLPHAKLYSRQEAFDANMKYLEPLIEHAKKVGIGLAVENMVDHRRNKRRYCGGDPYELLELVDAINDESVGVCVDIGHASQAGVDAAGLIRLAGKRVKATHIDDNFADEDTHILPFFGHNDWYDVAAALKEIGYDGDFSYELRFAQIPEAAVVDYYKFLHSIASALIK